MVMILGEKGDVDEAGEQGCGCPRSLWTEDACSGTWGGGGPGGEQGVAVCPDPRGWVATSLGQEGLLGSVRLTLPQDREGWA